MKKIIIIYIFCFIFFNCNKKDEIKYIRENYINDNIVAEQI